MKAQVLVLVVCGLLLGCATQHKVYKAPDKTKLIAAQKALNEKAATARATAAKARAATLKAQASGYQLIALAQAVKDKLAFLMSKVPPELVPFVKDVQDAAVAQEAQESILRTDVGDAVNFNAQLAAQNLEVEKARLSVQAEADKYIVDAGVIAADATNEREYRIKAESQLSKEKWTRILWRVFGGMFLCVIILIVGLWAFGKLGWAVGKIASKVP
jgi:hypothetical protein